MLFIHQFFQLHTYSRTSINGHNTGLLIIVCTVNFLFIFTCRGRYEASACNKDIFILQITTSQLLPSRVLLIIIIKMIYWVHFSLGSQSTSHFIEPNLKITCTITIQMKRQSVLYYIAMPLERQIIQYWTPACNKDTLKLQATTFQLLASQELLIIIVAYAWCSSQDRR